MNNTKLKHVSWGKFTQLSLALKGKKKNDQIKVVNGQIESINKKIKLFRRKISFNLMKLNIFVVVIRKT